MNNTASLTTIDEVKTVATLLTVFLLFFACIVFDMSVALGVAGGVPYIVPILFTFNLKSKGITYLIMLLAVLLTIAGLIFSPDGGELWKALTNRALVILAIISVGGAVIMIKTKNEQLHAKNKELAIQTERVVNVSKAKSRFLSAMSHELKTPLNIIMGFSQVLKMNSSLDPDALEDVERINDAGESLLKMVDGAISYADIQEGKISPEKEIIDIVELVDAVIKNNMTAAEQRSIQVIKHDIPEDDSLIVQTDSELLTTVLNIIVENSIYYNHKGGNVTLSVEKLDEMIKVQVSDTGQGIHDEHYTAVFDPFSRLCMENLTQSGLGLGLSKAKLISDMLGIKIECRRKAVGTIFWLEIPMT
jgi:signal transduction histidine kinase